jgi:N-acetylmuramoyl-L-alanine amidase
MEILLDAGHGKNTPGKRSPIWSDGTQLFEWEFNRDIVKRVSELLKAEKIPYIILVPEDLDISLKERCSRANKHKNAFLVSIHANAGGGTGWEIYTSVGRTKSDEYAQIIFKEFENAFPEFKMRTDLSDGDLDKESNFYILKNTKCPAVLLENFFMDTERDCKFIMSDNGRSRIALAIFNALKKIYYGL